MESDSLSWQAETTNGVYVKAAGSHQCTLYRCRRTSPFAQRANLAMAAQVHVAAPEQS